MAKDDKAVALMDAILVLTRKSTLPDRDVVYALFSVAAARAVRDQSFEDCVEFEDAAHDFFHTAQNVLEPPHAGHPSTLKVVH